MRLLNFADSTLRATMLDQCNHANMRAFAQPSFLGGWEVWLQCQSFSMLPDLNQYVCTREAAYPNGQKCDFQIRRLQADPITLWVELKVQLSDHVPGLIGRFVQDIAKIQNLNLPSVSNSIGAIAIVPLHCKSLFTHAGRKYFTDRTDVPLSAIHYQAIRPNAPVIASTWNLSGREHEFDDSYAVALSYQII